MSTPPLEFNAEEKGSLLDKIVRNSFRIPMDYSDEIWVKIENLQYPVRDICLNGIGITLDGPPAFAVSQVIQDCELNIQDRQITGLKGHVVHFSLNTGKEWQCGVQWVDRDEDTTELMTEIVLELKDKFLKDEQETD